MKNAWLALPLLLHFASSSSLKCNPTDNCLCLPGQQFEFQCPSNVADVGEFVIHITEEKEILIDCASDLEKFNIHHLPNITIGKIERFRMRFCPLPENGFKEVFDHFSLKEVKFLQYGSFNLSNTTLTKNYFQGLEFLDTLQLNADDLIDLEEDVFANTPNLTSLELQMNRIVLKPNLLKYTPMLKSLDMSENKFDAIPEGLFANLDKLELLHLWSNSLKAISDFTFQGLTNLKSLELSSNKIETISDNAFKSLVNLSRINLSKNKLNTLLSDTFSHNRKMELIVMRNNPNLKLPEYLFSNMPDLEEVDLTNCEMETIPEHVFRNSQKIKTVKLEMNKLKELPGGLFQGLENLEEVHLNNNKIERLGNVFAQLRKLKVLLLQENEIFAIEQKDFKDLINLEEISLKHNQIKSINNRAFYNNEHLKKIDLSNNQYSGEYNSQLILLENVPKVETVDLSHNQIIEIDDVIMLYNKVNLRVLDLSHNYITNISVKDLQPLAKKLTINLEYNNITTVNFALVDVITAEVKDAFSATDQSHSVICLANNPLVCDCYNYDLVRYFQNGLQPQVRVMFDIKTDDVRCASPPELKDMLVEYLPQKLLTCPFNKIGEAAACPEDCSCSWRPYDESLIMDCSNKNMTELPQLDLSYIGVKFNQTEVHLEGNGLSRGPDQNSTGYDNVTRLYLSHNNIKGISWLPPKLKVLQLDNNKITHLGYEVLNTLNSSNLLNLTLDNNPWRCECEAENFTNFLRQHPKVVDSRDVRCFNSTRRLINLNRNDLCHEWQPVYVFVAMLLILLVVAVAFVFYYRNKQELKVYLYAHNLCLWWVTEEELDKDKIYDAFISYSHKDEDFVVQNLLPVLEGGPTPYKLCLHYRNWIPGEFITTQVTNSVLDSRRTLVVLSPNFLESVWGKMEFRTAHTQAMTEGRARVIIVLYGDFDMDKLDDELKSYMKTNTYVKWGDPYFWNKLKYALPHSKMSVSNNNQKIANVMNCIDDKFNLVAPVTPSPGTTPPVLDSSVLKKHPLNFVPSPEKDTPPAQAGTPLVSTCL